MSSLSSRSLVALVLALVLLVPAAARAQEKAEHGFVDKVYKDADGTESKYVVFIPKAYDGTKPCPVILFLHGSGLSGDDGKRQAQGGLAKVVRQQAGSFPCIVIFPQSQKRGWGANSPDGKRAMAILDEVMK